VNTFDPAVESADLFEALRAAVGVSPVAANAALNYNGIK
jgi:hypothetical protein